MLFGFLFVAPLIANALASSEVVLGNGVVNFTVANGALVSVSEASSGSIVIAGDSWSVALTVATDPPISVNLSSTSPACVHTGSEYTTESADFTWTCSTAITPAHRLPLTYNVLVRYAAPSRAARFVSKTLSLCASDPWSTVGGGVYTIETVSPFGAGGLTLTHTGSGEATTHVAENPFARGLQIALFSRWAAVQAGAFVALANPWASFAGRPASTSGAVDVEATYSPRMVHRPSTFGGIAHISDAALIGLTSLGAYELEGVNLGERRAFISAVESFHLDTAARANGTVKVNVAWDESDYQIDVGTPAGRREYQRIIDRNAELGITHIVYEPRNTRVADRHNYTDGWGWEASLWFSMGERLRQGNWAPGIDPVDPSIQEMVAYARARGVGLLAYVYPCLQFEAHAEAFRDGALDLAAPGVAEWLAHTLEAFMRATGAAGFAWDHDIFAPEGGGMRPTAYAQWRAWMTILAHLRTTFPEMVMDHRQTAHAWGPWYHLAGSCTRPPHTAATTTDPPSPPSCVSVDPPHHAPDRHHPKHHPPSHRPTALPPTPTPTLTRSVCVQTRSRSPATRTPRPTVYPSHPFTPITWPRTIRASSTTSTPRVSCYHPRASQASFSIKQSGPLTTAPTHALATARSASTTTRATSTCSATSTRCCRRSVQRASTTSSR